MKLLVTGGAGFIGSNFVRLLASESEHELTVLDALTYAGNLANLEGIPAGRLRFVHADICDAAAVRACCAGQDAVVHFAAESHVDRSILDPGAFVRTNVLGTQVLLTAARGAGVERYVQVSTDEVYGSLSSSGRFSEESPLCPSSPYSASKAGADLLAQAAAHTFGLAVLITRCGNNYGPYQFPEKLIPLTILRAMRGEPIPVYGDGRNVRDWIHVEDHCRAIWRVLEAGAPGRVYNVGSDGERPNLEIVREILRLVGTSRDLITFVRDRPGHDFRYALDSSRLRRELGWSPRWTLGSGLAATVRWYREHPEWWGKVLSGEYLEYTRRQYGALAGGAGG